jgi:hypothetical protein
MAQIAVAAIAGVVFLVQGELVLGGILLVLGAASIWVYRRLAVTG